MNHHLAQQIETLAADLRELSDECAVIADALLTILYSTPAADGLDHQVTSLVGETSIATLLALVVEAKADTKPIRDLPVAERLETRHGLLALATGIADLTHSHHAENAAWRLNPAD